MGKKVTFGIDFATVSNAEAVLKKNLNNYKTFIANGQKEQAAQIIIDTAEMVLYEGDMDDADMLHHIPTVIKHCLNIIKLLKNKELLPRYDKFVT